jgi:hypothetical protein
MRADSFGGMADAGSILAVWIPHEVTVDALGPS